MAYAPVNTPVITNAADALFKNAYQLDQQGKNDQAIAAYIAALDAGLREPQKSVARLEVGLLSALQATDLYKKGQKVESRAPCNTAVRYLDMVLDPPSEASADTKSEAYKAIQQIKSICLGAPAS